MKTLHLASILGGLLLGALIIGTTAQGAPTVPPSGGNGTTYTAARDAGIVITNGSILACRSASQTATGCVTPEDQAFFGRKVFGRFTTFSADGGSYSLKIQSGYSTTAGRGICFSEDGTADSCTHSITMTPSSGYMVLNASYVVTPYIDTYNTIATTSLITTSRGGGNVALLLSGNGYFQMSGVAGASLPTCDNTREGAIHYDTTAHKHKGCDGTTWNALY
jgi:hypothetical protein